MKILPGILAVLLLLAIGACSGSDTGDTAQSKTILVTGATGTQGGAVARELVSRGYDVRGLTRNPDSNRARALHEIGITVVKGDFDDAGSLAAAMTDVHGVFAVTNFWEHGYDREIAHGRQLIDAAKAAGVQHFVFTSVAEADTGTGISHFDSKYEIEKVLTRSGLGYSIVRPVEFMDNLRYSEERILSGILADPRDASRQHQWIAARDIGFFVGEAFDNPDDWLGAALDIAGDEMTISEFAELLSNALGFDVSYQQVPWENFEQLLGEEMTTMYRWFDDPGYSVDIESLREKYPNLTSMQEYVAGLAWEEQ